MRLDRLARSIRDLLTLVDTIQAAGARIKALEDPWLDTTTPHGELILTIMGGMHEFERKLIRTRCDEGIGGRRPAGFVQAGSDQGRAARAGRGGGREL